MSNVYLCYKLVAVKDRRLFIPASAVASNEHLQRRGVFKQVITITSQKVEVDISAFNEGIYYLNATTGTKPYTTKFVVHH